MKRYLMAMALASSTLAGPAFAAADVSIQIGQPGFYGRLDIDDYYAPPALIYSRPVVIERVAVDRPPVYLHVPPGHARHWRSHCQEYNACGERVYFVRDDSIIANMSRVIASGMPIVVSTGVIGTVTIGVITGVTNVGTGTKDSRDLMPVIPTT
jgi:hypothetical protein